MAEGNNNFGASFMDNFSCKICFEVLDDPVQCQNNEHYFCRKCITKHLHDSTETCPVCADQLTLETLRPVPRVVLEVVSQLKKPLCSNVSRGCTENVRVEELLLHEQTCGYAPVVCSNEACEETVNRRDKDSHETEECKFRKKNCESCSEEMTYNDYEKHRCRLRKELNEVRSRLEKVNTTLNQLALTQGKMLEKLNAHDQSIKDLQNPLHHFSSASIQRENTIINGQIFFFSGNYLEVFNWSTKTWTVVGNCLFFSSNNKFSFLYGKKIMVCSGDRIEYLNPSESGFTSNVFPGILPSGGGNGVLLEKRIITFGYHVQETSLEPPWKSTVLIQGQGDMNSTRRDCAVECFGKDIFVIGFSGNKVERYNSVSNELKTLTLLPYRVYYMASVTYKDNIIILGGQNEEERVRSWYPLNDVLMYNINSLECKRLPLMLEKRSRCAAVIMGDVIVVMGGVSKDTNGWTRVINTVEYYVIGDSTWKELPAMNFASTWLSWSRTACVYA